MIKARTPSTPLGPRWWFAFVVAFGLLLTAGFLRPSLDPGRHVPTAAPVPTAPVPTAPVPTAPASTACAGACADPAPSSPVPIPPALSSPALSSPAPSTAPTAVPIPVNLPSIPGAVPAKGAGTFSYAPGRGKILGTGGPMRRFRVAVERGSGEDVTAFAEHVEATLGDERSWTGGGRLRLQRVAGAEAADFTVYLATRETAGLMCARGGVNIRVGGQPHTSCRAPGKAIINLDRWRLSARPYLAAKVPLTTYRHYVINHEVGHELGHSHQGCPKRGGPAPVMVQQTLTLRGCTPYAWPRRGSLEFVGPAV